MINGWLYYLSESLLDEVTTVLDVRQQISVGMIQNADGLIDEQVRKHVFHTKGHVQDVGHLRKQLSHYHYNP